MMRHLNNPKPNKFNLHGSELDLWYAYHSCGLRGLVRRAFKNRDDFFEVISRLRNNDTDTALIDGRGCAPMRQSHSQD